MKPQEINRVAQYITARTSYSREDTATILETTFSELAALAENKYRDIPTISFTRIRDTLDYPTN